MKRLFLVSTILFCITLANAQNPFEAYGYTPKIATLSNGKYNEFHDLDTIVQIGTVLFNTQTKQIVAFLQVDTLYSEATLQPDIVSMWLSPDPLASEFPSFSPYNYCYNNPIRFVDPDGLAADDPPWVYGQLYSNSIASGRLQSSDVRNNAIGAVAVLFAPAIILGADAALPYLASWALALSSNPELVVGIGGLTLSIIDPSPMNDYPGGLDDVFRGAKILFKNSQGVERFIFNTRRFSYFFGKGTGTPENISKSIMRNEDFLKLGITDSKLGKTKLFQYMNQAIDAPLTNELKYNTKSGTWDGWKIVDVTENGVHKGKIKFGVSYTDKTMQSTPEIRTAIPMPSDN